MINQFVGDLAENYTRKYLEGRGLIWECSQFRCKQGEIDLIMYDQTVLVFVEVRYRQNADCGSGIETVSRAKQQRVIKAAWQFLLERRLIDQINCRFDVVGIAANGEINWIQNAFEVEY